MNVLLLFLLFFCLFVFVLFCVEVEVVFHVPLQGVCIFVLFYFVCTIFCGSPHFFLSVVAVL